MKQPTEVDPEANIIFGSAFNPELEGTIRVSVVATGIEDLHYQPAEKKEVLAHAPKPSTIEQMQQLYRSEPIDLLKTTSAPMTFDLRAVSASSAVTETPEEQITQASEAQPEKEITEAPAESEKEPNKYPGVFFSPRAIDPAEQQPIKSNLTSIKKPEKEAVKSPFGLFTKMVNSVGLNFNKDEPEEHEEVYILSEDKQVDEDELVTDEMLNIPAYQRRK